ncbi:MAG TPA: radical SAM protein [Candidatus Methanofastidiosa archaeon]|nr:radical SAM protein [Candidatus Methanofastidiosa archaeon]
MRVSIIDCYTDEPSGLGVMPYIGTYPRYIFGALRRCRTDAHYLTIDDIRSQFKQHDIEGDMKTHIGLRNTTPNAEMARELLSRSDVIIVIAGMHTPGKYLSASPGTTVESMRLLSALGLDHKFKILTGPASTIGSGLYGGRMARGLSAEREYFDMIVPEVELVLDKLLENNFTDVPTVEDKYGIIGEIAPYGAAIVDQLPHNPSFLIAEIETMSGCAKQQPCSFCIEKLKSPDVVRRDPKDIIREARSLSSSGLRNFRVGKQTCIYSYGNEETLENLFGGLSKISDILHIDNANPLFVNVEKTKVLVKYCSPGNVASLGVESFDGKVVENNDLHNGPDIVFEKIALINEVGAMRGHNGMPCLLPGINILFGLDGESRSTHEENMLWLRRILDAGLMLRRINIREVVLFPGTRMGDSTRGKFLRKNRDKYWKWRNEIRKEIDYPMLQRLVPSGTLLRSLRTEVYDGNTTFARQVGTYPLVVGVPGRLGLDRLINARVTGHMLRSVKGDVVDHPTS